jgi:hypothetical protein
MFLSCKLQFNVIIITGRLLDELSTEGVDKNTAQGHDSPPTFTRLNVPCDGSDTDVDNNDKDDVPLTHYAFRVSRSTVLAMQRAIRNIVSHYFNDHSSMPSILML